MRVLLRPVLLRAITGAAVLTLGLLAGFGVVAAQAATAPTIAVFPVPGGQVAAPTTQITFRGAPAARLGTITVTGSQSGGHTGHLAADSDGQGASFLPDAPFRAGETVTVHTGLNVLGATGGTWAFRIATPAGAIPGRAPTRSARVAGDVLSLHSRPDLVPAAVRLLHTSASAAAGDIFIAPQEGPVQNGPMILDSSGHLVWYEPMAATDTATDFRTQTLGGQPVLTWWQGNVNGAGVGNGTGIILDRNYRQIAVVHAGNGLTADLHEFQITPRRTALLTAYYPVIWDASSVHGSHQQITLDTAVQEVDISTGLVLFQWDSLDHVPVSDTYSALPAARTKNPFDYFHINSAEQASDGNLIVSARNTWATYDIDHRTAGIIWQLGGKRSSISMGSGTGTAFQHDVRLDASGNVTVFDNGGGPPTVHSQARAILETLDAKRSKATLVRQFEHSPALHVNYEGSAESLTNGDVFVGWGQQPYFSEFTGSGSQILDGRFVGTNNSYRAYKFAWTGQPLDPPAVSAVTGTGGTTTVYASWNGASNVARWQVLAGPSVNSLTPVATATRTDFETAIAAPTSQPYIAVQALDNSGRVLGTSATTGVHGRVAVFGTTAFAATSGGVAGVLLGCFGTLDCVGNLTLTVGSTVIGTRTGETVPRNTGAFVHVTLTSAGRSMLAHAGTSGLPVRVTVDDGDYVGASAVVNLVPFTSSGAPPATSATPSATVRTFGSTAFVSGGGVGGVFVGCFGSAPCAAAMTISAGGTVIGHRSSAQLLGDDGGIVHISLTAAGQKLVAQARGNQLPVQVTVTDTAHHTARATLNLVRFG